MDLQRLQIKILDLKGLAILFLKSIKILIKKVNYWVIVKIVEGSSRSKSCKTTNAFKNRRSKEIELVIAEIF